MRITVTAAILVIVLALIAVPAMAGDWQGARNDVRHTSYAQDKLSPPLEVDWSVNAGGGIVASPVISNGILYYSNDTGKSIIAMNLSTRTVLFKQSVGGPIESTPTVTDNTIFFGAYDGNVYSLYRSDGSLDWKTPLKSGIFSSPLVYLDHVYIGTDDGDFYALYSGNGTVAWTLPDSPTQGSPAGDDGKVFIGLLDGKVLALDSGTGNVIWNFNTTDSVHSSPMIYNGIVYIASRSGKLYALDEITGRQRWVADLGYKTDATPALDPATGTLFVGTFGGYVHAVNASTGDTLWVSQFYGPVYATTAVAGDTVYGNTQDGILFALSVADGSERWTYDLGSETWASPAIAGGRLVTGTMNGTLYVFKESAVATTVPSSRPASVPATNAATTPFTGLTLCVIAIAAGAVAAIRRP